MNKPLELLQQWVDAGWLRHLDRALARWVAELDPQARPELLMATALPDDHEHPEYNWSRGHVHDIAYLGGHSVYYVKLTSGQVVQCFIANAERRGKRPTWDDPVVVYWEDDSGVVLQS